jgi:nucleoside diphosphate kinase
MYRAKPKAVVILEETFVLLKPDVADHHGAIIDEFREAGFFITTRQMPSTRTMLEEIAYHFADVAAMRREAERVEELNATTYGMTRNRQLDMSINSSVMASAASPPLQRNASAFTFNGGATANQSRRTSLAERASTTDRQSSSWRSRGQSPPRMMERMATVDRFATPEDVHAGWEALRRRHVDHMLRGTCIAMSLSASDAVDRVAKLCGPEDPEVAKNSVPSSLRSRYGKTVIENAVFCAPDHQVAGELIFKVFGYEPQVRTEALHEGSDAGVGSSSVGSGAHDGVAEKGSEKHATMLFQPAAHLAGVEFHPTITSGAATKLDADHVFDLSDLSSPAQIRTARETLLAERDALRREAETLRLREVDLLLREEKFAAQVEELRRGMPAASGGGGGGGGFSGSVNMTSTLSPVPPPRRSGGQPQLRGTPVTMYESSRVGTAMPPASLSRQLDHHLGLRAKAQSRHALHAAHLRETIPEKRLTAAALRKSLRDVKRAVEMAASQDPRTEASDYLSLLWTTIRAREAENERLVRVALPPGSPPFGPMNVSPSASSPVRTPRIESIVGMRSPPQTGAVSLENTVNSVAMLGQTAEAVPSNDTEALRATNAVLQDVFTRFFQTTAAMEVNAWCQQCEQLEEEIAAADAKVEALEADLKVNESKPQFVDVDGIAALADLSSSDLAAIAASPGTITSLFLRFDSARDTGRIKKADFVRFYEACSAFRDTGIVDDARRVREMVATKYSAGKATLSLDEFSALLLWLVRT